MRVAKHAELLLGGCAVSHAASPCTDANVKRGAWHAAERVLVGTRGFARLDDTVMKRAESTRVPYDRQPRYGLSPVAEMFDAEARTAHAALVERGFADEVRVRVGADGTEARADDASVSTPRAMDVPVAPPPVSQVVTLLAPHANGGVTSSFRGAEMRRQVALHDAWRRGEKVVLGQRKKEAKREVIRSRREQRRHELELKIASLREKASEPVHHVFRKVAGVAKCAKAATSRTSEAFMCGATAVVQATQSCGTSIALAIAKLPPPSVDYMLSLIHI